MNSKSAKPSSKPFDYKEGERSLFGDVLGMGAIAEIQYLLDLTSMNFDRKLEISNITKEVDKYKQILMKYPDPKKLINNYKFREGFSKMTYKVRNLVGGLEQYLLSTEDPKNPQSHFNSPTLDSLRELTQYLKGVSKQAAEYMNFLGTQTTDYKKAQEKAVTSQKKSQTGNNYIKNPENSAAQQVYVQAQADASGGKSPDYRDDVKGKLSKGKPKAAESLLAIMFVLSLSFLGLSVFHGAQKVELVDSFGTTGMFIGPSNALGDSIWNVYTESIGFVYIIVSISVLAIFGIGRLAKQW
jgi:hypothetical protein